MDDKLKPCPFCGSPAEMLEDSHHNKPDWRVWCTECSCEMVAIYFSEAEAITAWNRRASPPDLEGVIHQIKKIADEYKQLINPASATFEILGKIIALSSLPNSPGGVGERERLEDERNVLMNSFGVSPFRDGLTRQRIEEIDRALATAPTAEGKE